MKKIKQRLKDWIFRIFKTQIMKTFPPSTHIKIESQGFDVVVARARVHSDTYRKLQYDELSREFIAKKLEQQLKEMLYKEVMEHIVISEQRFGDESEFVEAKLYLAIKK